MSETTSTGEAGAGVPTDDEARPSSHTGDADAPAAAGEAETGPRPFRRADVVASISDRTGLPRPKANAAVTAFIATLSDHLRSGQHVRLAGFGSFVVSDRKAGKGRDPRTGAEIDIPSTRSVRFRPAKGLKAAVSGQGPDAGGESTPADVHTEEEAA